jgi:Type IV secretion-system coupling protein DNA-binding domain
MNEKPIYLWPSDKRILDGTRPVVYVGQAIFIGAFGFLFCLALAFIALWFFTDKPPIENRMDIFRTYFTMVHNWFTVGDSVSLTIRKGLSLAIGSLGFWWFSKNAWEPMDLNVQVRGRKLFKGKKGFADLKAVMDRQIRTSAAGLIMATNVGFNVMKPETYDPKKAIIIYQSDQARRTGNLIIGGTRRGKGVKNKEIVMQIYYHQILKKKLYKLLIIDTPKGEYAELFHKRDMIQIAPDEKFSVPHDIAKDLLLPQDFAQFSAGLINVSEKDPFWGTSARGFTTGIGAFLVKEAGTDWSYNNFAYFKDLSVETLTPLLDKYYPELGPILRMGDTPLSSIVGTVASNLMFLNDVARIWDGYDYKVEIHQMSAKLLKRKFWLEWYLVTAFPVKQFIQEDGKDVEVIVPWNVCTSSFLYSHIQALNKSKPKWKWADLKAALQQPWDRQVKIVHEYVDSSQLQHVDKVYLTQYLKAIEPILKWAEVWDGYEGRERFSMRRWLLDENPKKKVVFLKPSGRFKSQMDGVIRGMLLYMTSMINDKFYQEDKTKELPLRNLHIFCDEFQSLGNLKDFVQPGLEMFASKGVTIYLSCQDFSQLKAIYGQEFLEFIQANTGNIYMMGLNQGTSAEMVSNLVGKKHISKTHTSKTMQESGTSTSINNQVHDNESVITPDEVNSLFGTKGNEIHYLYLPGNEANAYLMTAPVVRDYPKPYKPEPADWISGKTYKAAAVDMDKLRVALLGTPPAGGSAPKQRIDTFIDEDDVVKDAASDMTEEDYSEEELDAMEANIHRAERAPLYNLPSEEEGMQGSLMKDIALDVLGGSLAKSVSHVAEIFTEAKRNVTTSKKKADDAWRIKRDGLDEMTKH